MLKHISTVRENSDQLANSIDQPATILKKKGQNLDKGNSYNEDSYTGDEE